MKTIAKIAALAMTLSLAFVLTACGGSASSSAASSSASSAASSASASTSASASASSTAASSASASAASSSASVDASTATSYVNDFFGLEYILPAGWQFMDASSIKEVNSSVASITNSESLAMMAMNPTTGSTVVVGVVEASAETNGKTAQDFLNTQVAELQGALKEAGIDHMSTEAEVTFEGLSRTLPANFTSIKIGDQQLVIALAVAEKDGNFLDIIAIGTSDEEVQNAFTAFKATAA